MMLRNAINQDSIQCFPAKEPQYSPKSKSPQLSSKYEYPSCTHATNFIKSTPIYNKHFYGGKKQQKLALR